MATDTRRIAVLIDADNASAAHARAIFEEVAKHGEANIRRMYGEFSQQRLKGWVDQMLPLAITARFERAFTSGKNAADIAMVIDAMDLMHTGVVDTFCLVTSDSDFTGLARRLRENDKTVLGFGERKTPEAFRNACNRFIYIENLEPAVADAAPVEAAGEDKKGGRRRSTAKTTRKSGGGGQGQEQPAPEPAESASASGKEPPSRATARILKAMADLEDEEGWATLGAVGSQLLKIFPDFDPRTYGSRKLSDVVQKSGAFEVEKTDGGQLRIRQL